MTCSGTRLEVSGSQLTERGGGRGRGGNGGCIVVSLVGNTLFGLIINVYCNDCPRDEGT